VVSLEARAEEDLGPYFPLKGIFPLYLNGARAPSPAFAYGLAIGEITPSQRGITTAAASLERVEI
jgi:hypothetical protein